MLYIDLCVIVCVPNGTIASKWSTKMLYAWGKKNVQPIQIDSKIDCLTVAATTSGFHQNRYKLPTIGRQQPHESMHWTNQRKDDFKDHFDVSQHWWNLSSSVNCDCERVLFFCFSIFALLNEVYKKRCQRCFWFLSRTATK